MEKVMKKALVTGGCGFIGSNLTKKLVSEGWVVDVVDNLTNGYIESLDGININVFTEEVLQLIESKNRKKDSVFVIHSDFASTDMLNYIRKGNYDIIFHQAALPRVEYSVKHPGLTTKDNVFKTVELFEAASGNVERIVWASSSSIYGGAIHLPTHESEKGVSHPKSPYAWQKYAIEDYAKMACNLYDIDIVCLRYFNVFGPGQGGDSPYSTAVAAWCYHTKLGNELRSDGTGEQTRDMCYIDNVVYANILAALSDQKAYGGFKGSCYNIACGSSVSNIQILDYFRNNFKVSVENVPERPGDVKHTLANIERAREDFGYKPLVSFWEGLEKTIDWWGLQKLPSTEGK